MKIMKYIILSSVLFSFAVAISKIGYVDSNEIMRNFEEVRLAEIELEKEGRKLEAEGIKLVSKLDSLKQDYERQRLLMSETRQNEKKNEITNMEKSIQNFQMEKFGPEGEIYRIQSKLMKPISEKIQAAIDIVGKEQGYDLILDALSGAIVYALPQYNLTEAVIDELNKTTESFTE